MSSPSSEQDLMQTDEQPTSSLLTPQPPSKYLFRFDKGIIFDKTKESDKLLTIKGEYNFISRELIQDFLIRNIKSLISTKINLSELKMKKQDIYKIYCIQSMVISFTRIKNSFEGIGTLIFENIKTISDEQLKSDVIAIYKYFFSDDIDINARLKDVTKELFNVEIITKINFDDDLIKKLERFKKALVLFLIIVNNTINSNKDKYKCSQCDKKSFTLEIYKHNFNSGGNKPGDNVSGDNVSGDNISVDNVSGDNMSVDNVSDKKKESKPICTTLKTYHSSSYKSANCYMIGFFDLYNIQFNVFDASDRNIIIIKQKERYNIPIIKTKNEYDNYNNDTPSTTSYALHKTGYLECDTVTMNARDEAETSTCTIENSLIKKHEYILTANEPIPIIKLSFNDGEKDYDILNYILEQLSSTIRTEYSFLKSEIEQDTYITKMPAGFETISLETYTVPSSEADCKCKNICIKFSDDISKKQLSFQNIKDIMKHIEENIKTITTTNLNEYIKNEIIKVTLGKRKKCDDESDDDCDGSLGKKGKNNKYYLDKYIKYKMKYINLKNELDLSNHFDNLSIKNKITLI